jgi:hypothetical protein
VKHAIITENIGVGGVEIINEVGDNAVLRDNEPKDDSPTPPTS